MNGAGQQTNGIIVDLAAMPPSAIRLPPWSVLPDVAQVSAFAERRGVDKSVIAGLSNGPIHPGQGAGERDT